jgi:hypothetical protein
MNGIMAALFANAGRARNRLRIHERFRRVTGEGGAVIVSA